MMTDDNTPPNCGHNGWLDGRLQKLTGDVGEMKLALKEMTAAVVKLALVEERQAQASSALERVFAALDKLETRMSEMERSLPNLSRTSVWVDRAVWAGAAVAVMFVAKKAGLL